MCELAVLAEDALVRPQKVQIAQLTFGFLGLHKLSYVVIVKLKLVELTVDVALAEVLRVSAAILRSLPVVDYLLGLHERIADFTRRMQQRHSLRIRHVVHLGPEVILISVLLMAVVLAWLTASSRVHVSSCSYTFFSITKN